MKLTFTKMEGIGNDYVYIDCTQQPIAHPKELAVRVSDRHFGIGSDGLILIKKSECADFTMEMYNADGSRSEMCGNGIRCVGKYVYDHGLTDQTDLAIETLAGIKYLHLYIEKSSENDRGTVTRVRVNMGNPILMPAEVPVDTSGIEKLESERNSVRGSEHKLPVPTASTTADNPSGSSSQWGSNDYETETVIRNFPLEVKGQTYHITCVSMGNPHCVSFIQDVDQFPIDEIGSIFESHPLFPHRINAEFAEIVNRSYIKMRVYERGTGETFACGTGTCATAVAAILNGLTDDEVTVKLLGGELQIYWDRKSGDVYMTGPAETVFEGVIEAEC